MRYISALMLLLPACLHAGLREYVDGGFDAQSMGVSEMRLLAWYAVAACLWIGMRMMYARKFAHGACWLVAAAGCWYWPTAGAFAIFAVVTGLIILLGLSRK